MNFEKILSDIVNSVPGSIAATLMGFDGIAVAHHVKEKSAIDIETLAVEYTRTISEIVRTAGAINAGNIQEITLTTNNYFIIFNVLPDNYFVALLLKDNSNLGKGRYILRRSAPDFVSQL